VRFDPENPNQAFNGRQAAAYLGVSEVTLRRLRHRGAIPAFRIPSRGRGARVVWRYRIEDLQDFVTANGYTEISCSDDGIVFPVAVIASLIGVSAQAIRIQKWRGRLRGYDPNSVREYLLRVSRKSLAAEIRRNFASKLANLQAHNRRLRRLLKFQNCNACGEARVEQS
jgi:excisionase family DNA binding protein